MKIEFKIAFGDIKPGEKFFVRTWKFPHWFVKTKRGVFRDRRGRASHFHAKQLGGNGSVVAKVLFVEEFLQNGVFYVIRNFRRGTRIGRFELLKHIPDGPDRTEKLYPRRPGEDHVAWDWRIAQEYLLGMHDEEMLFRRSV